METYGTTDNDIRFQKPSNPRYYLPLLHLRTAWPAESEAHFLQTNIHIHANLKHSEIHRYTVAINFLSINCAYFVTLSQLIPFISHWHSYGRTSYNCHKTDTNIEPHLTKPKEDSMTSTTVADVSARFSTLYTPPAGSDRQWAQLYVLGHI